MSDPVTNVEIEDVLSSIRRLVSAEERDEGAEAREERAELEKDDKLVLTPAQRVDDPPGGDASDASEAAAEAADYEVETREERSQESDRFDGIDIEDAEIADSPEADPEEDAEAPDVAEAAQDDLPDLTYDLGAPAATDDVTTDDAATGDAPVLDEMDADDLSGEGQIDLESRAEEPPQKDTPDAAELQEPEGTSEVLAARIAEFEALVAEQDEEWEPDGSSEDGYAGGPVTPLPWQDEDSGPDEAGTGDETAAEEAFSEPEETGDETTAEEAPVKPEEVSDETTAEEAPVKPEEAGDETTVEEAPSEPEEADDDTSAKAPDVAADAEDDAQDDAGNSWYDDDPIIDEEVLRDMVSEIVRQELQGALGERITRNVRKLVRREIHRALMSQGIE